MSDLGDSYAHAFIATSSIFWYYLFSYYALFSVLFNYLLVLLVSDRYC
jgi:hypothetical protein